MPTEIKIVMPATEDDDIVSDNEETSSRNCCQPGVVEVKAPTNCVEPSSRARPRPERSKSAHSGRRRIRTRHRSRVRNITGPEKHASEVPLHTAYPHYLNKTPQRTHSVVLNKELPETQNKKVKESPTKPQEIHVSITASYVIQSKLGTARAAQCKDAKLWPTFSPPLIERIVSFVTKHAHLT